MSEEELKNKMDTFIECYKNGMIFGPPTDIEFYEKITTLQQKVEEKDKEIDRLNNIINRARRKLGEYKHYSTPTEEQNKENEDITDEVYQILHGNLYELKENNK